VEWRGIKLNFRALKEKEDKTEEEEAFNNVIFYG
jgi:hypothetical protein